MNTAADERFLRLPEVTDRTGLSRSSVYAYISRGEFPPPVRVGARASGWTKSSVDRWMADRIAASGTSAKSA